MSAIELSLQELLASIDPGKRINIAFSGGIDSTVLLHAANKICDQVKHEIRAIHINHQIHADAPHWEKACLAYCHLINVNYLSIKVDISPHRGSGIEGAARTARYQAFAQHLTQDDVLLMAHHADDQFETSIITTVSWCRMCMVSQHVPVVVPIGQAFAINTAIHYTVSRATD